MSGPRETAIAALQSLVAVAFSWTTGPSRRLKLWADIPLSQRPAVFLFEGGNENHTFSNSINPKRVMEVKLFVYINAKDMSVPGAIQLNNIMDALDAVFMPQGADLQAGRNTLGGAVYNCKIEGQILKDPGDLDGDGLLIAPVKLILP
jgi:hypothetical protein